ncbi:MAG: hypothetical protein ACRD21_15685 [Vicinamibacteria bacterium]
MTSESEENYYAEIETYFVARRGSPLFITPGEWDLAWRWEQLGIPLSAVKEGIDRVFERPKANLKPRKLGYCRQTVEAAFRRFREARLGGGSAGEMGEEGASASSHLAELSSRLRTLADEWSETNEAFARSLRSNAELVESSESEEELARVEGSLFLECEAVVGDASREELRKEAASSLECYRDRMPERVYRAALESAYRRRLRKRLDLPTLSLYTR